MDLTYIRDDGAGEEPNWRRWESSLTIAQKRVLATWWCGDAYAKLLTEPYQHALAAAWTKGGCDAGAPGFDISHVGIQGLHRPFSAYDGDVEAAYTHIRRIYIYIYIIYMLLLLAEESLEHGPNTTPVLYPGPLHQRLLHGFAFVPLLRPASRRRRPVGP